MITPYPPTDYPWSVGAALAREVGASGDLAQLQRAVAFHELAELDPQVRPFATGLFRASEQLLEPALAVPERGSIGELAAWCASRLDVGATWQIGRATGVICRAYAHRGWAVLAAAVAVGDAADRLPAWDGLVDAVSREVARRVQVAARSSVLQLPPDPGVLAAIGWPAPSELVGTTLRELAAAITSTGGAVISASTRLDRALDAAWGDHDPSRRAPAYGEVDPSPELAAWVAQLTSPWSWRELAEWQDGDPMATARAIARAVGLGGWIAVFDELGDALTAQIADSLATAWQRALAAAFTDHPPATPLVLAIAALAEHAAVSAATQIGQALRTSASGAELEALCARLLGDPRGCEDVWRAAGPAVVAALEAA